MQRGTAQPPIKLTTKDCRCLTWVQVHLQRTSTVLIIASHRKISPMAPKSTASITSLIVCYSTQMLCRRRSCRIWPQRSNSSKCSNKTNINNKQIMLGRQPIPLSNNIWLPNRTDAGISNNKTMCETLPPTPCKQKKTISISNNK